MIDVFVSMLVDLFDCVGVCFNDIVEVEMCKFDLVVV